MRLEGSLKIAGGYDETTDISTQAGSLIHHQIHPETLKNVAEIEEIEGMEEEALKRHAM